MAVALRGVPQAAALPGSSFQRYYEEAGPDYAAWSPSFNMHFGFFRRGMNPFGRETMLEQMNLEVLDRLRLPAERPRILDVGVGSGEFFRAIGAVPGLRCVGVEAHAGYRAALRRSLPSSPGAQSPLAG